MMDSSSAAGRPMRTSVSMPRSRKISAARGLRSSEIRTRNMSWSSMKTRDCGSWLAAGLGEGPVEPGQERLDVRGLDRGAAPDAQAWRRVAIGADVEGNPFRLEPVGDGLGESRLARRIAREK